MGFILTLVFITAFFTAITWYSSCKSIRRSNTACTAVVLGSISGIMIIVIIFASYINYVDTMKDGVNITNAYNKAVSLYTAYANVPTGVQGNRLASDLTDKKYEDYQRYLNNYVYNMQNKTANYNKSVVGKAYMNNSWYWGVLIYYPKNLPILELPSPL